MPAMDVDKRSEGEVKRKLEVHGTIQVAQDELRLCLFVPPPQPLFIDLQNSKVNHVVCPCDMISVVCACEGAWVGPCKRLSSANPLQCKEILAWDIMQTVSSRTKTAEERKPQQMLRRARAASSCDNGIDGKRRSCDQLSRQVVWKPI